MALTEKFSTQDPGFPLGETQIIDCASPYFRVVSNNSGRLDYMGDHQAMEQTVASDVLNFGCDASQTSGYFLIGNRNFRFKLMSLVRGCQYECFEREIVDHRRMIFERIEESDAWRDDRYFSFDSRASTAYR